ncbi:hypothetical protein [Burkholderia ambifaria]|uniref:hypothetical protein n=1 Tax=Burkholderia ambifaria TaxID=152480 RepID=UPI00347D4AE8
MINAGLDTGVCSRSVPTASPIAGTFSAPLLVALAAYRRSRPGLPTIAGIDRKALLQKALRRNRQILHEKDDYPRFCSSGTVVSRRQHAKLPLCHDE